MGFFLLGAPGTRWSQIPIGGGGFMTGMDIAASDGTTIARSDTPPALYRWSSAQSAWIPLVTSNSMPAGYINPRLAAGCWDARICPSTPTKFYMMYTSTMLVTTDSGATWTQLTNFPVITDGEANDVFRGYNYRMAVDPQNDLVCFVGTPSAGLQRTLDGGASWTTRTVGTGTGTSGAGMFIAFDPTSSVVSGKKQGLFVCRYNDGVYHSTDGGGTFAALNTTGMPTKCFELQVDSSGKVWVCADDGTAQNLWTWTSGTGWVQNAFNYEAARSLSIDPNNTSHLCIAAGGGILFTSINGGSSWSNSIVTSGSVTINADANSAWQQTSWTHGGGSYFVTCSKILFDPINTGRLWQTHGLGVMYCSNPFVGVDITFQTQGKGIESYDACMVVHPPLGNPVGTGWDLPIWNLTSYTASPSVYKPSTYFAGINPVGLATARGWGIDYAKSDPSYLAIVGGITIGGMYSSNKGVDWTAFPDQTPFANGSYGGTMAVSTPLNMVVMCNSIYYTTDGGTTFHVPTTYTGGYSFSSNLLPSQFVCADPNNASTFYLYSAGTGVGGVFKSTDSGNNWTETNAGSRLWLNLAEGLSMRMKAVPGKSGHLFLTGGFKDTGTPPNVNSLLYRSTDSGVNWTAVSNVYDVWCFDFGTTVSGQSYPTIYFVGWYNGNFGVFKTIDNFSTVTRLGEQYPGGFFRVIYDVAADPSIDGACTIAFFGGGFKTYR